jgi:hypothetical protein
MNSAFDQEHTMHQLIRTFAAVVVLSCGPTLAARAQSEASVTLSMLPIASVVGTASVAAASVGALSAAPVVLSVAGSVLTVQAVQASASGTVLLLERASDSARFSVEVAASSMAGAAVLVGTAVAVSVIGSGVILSAAGEAIAFIPNAVGRALLHNERVAY